MVESANLIVFCTPGRKKLIFLHLTDKLFKDYIYLMNKMDPNKLFEEITWDDLTIV